MMKEESQGNESHYDHSPTHNSPTFPHQSSHNSHSILESHVMGRLSLWVSWRATDFSTLRQETGDDHGVTNYGTRFVA